MKGFISAVLVIGALQGLVLAVLLLVKRRGNRLANRILASIILLLSVSILLHLVCEDNNAATLEKHHIWSGILSIASAPLIFFYVQALTLFAFRFKRKDLLYFLPFLIAIILGTPLLLFSIPPPAAGMLLGIFQSLNALTISCYIVAANVKLFQYARMIKERYSSLEKINLLWLRVFLFGLTLFWVFAGINELIIKAISWDIVWLASCTIILLIGNFGFTQSEIFSHVVGDTDTEKEAAVKYEKSSLTPELSAAYLKRLEKAMSAQKLYQDPNLSLPVLAAQTGISSHHLSQVINEKTGLNFYDYINRRRIEEAKKMLLDPSYKNRNIATIGFDAGFNSLSAFNAAFKKFVKKTPSQFRRAD